MKFILLVSLLLASFTTLADNSTGCGLGSMIWKENSIVSALFRLTTNHSFSTQLFGITSGTSGCSQHSIVKRDMAPVYYAEANLEEIKLDMAKGNGEYVSVFSEALGCPESLKSDFAKQSQKRFSHIFPKPEVTPLEMLENVKQMINENPALSGRCSYAIL